MERHIAVRVLVIVLFCLLCFTPTVAALAPAQPEAPPGEPNDTFGTASAIDPDGSAQGAIVPRGDADWYALTVDRPGELQVKMTGSAATLDLVFRVWNANKDVVADWMSPLNKGGDTNGIVDLAVPGRYYLEVHDGSDDAESPQPYTLSTTFTPVADTGERNDSIGSATPLAFDTPMQATILPRGDADWFVVDVDQHGELTVALTQVPPTLELVFRVWNANKDVIKDWIAPLAAGGDTTGIIDLPAPGSYYLEVRDGSDSDRSAAPYTITAAFKPSADLFEPNNAFGAATPLKLGEVVPATILPAGDADWFAFDVPHHGELTLAASNVAPDLAVFVRVWNANKDTISDWFRPLNKGGDTQGSVDLPAAGRYLLEVVGDSGQRAIQPFNLRVDFAAAADTFEPNNNFGQAAELGVDRSAQANILPAGDADWFQFDVPGPGELHLRVTGVDPAMAVYFRVWNANKDVVADWFRPLNKGGDTDGIFDVGTPGRYYLEAAADSGQRSIQPYSLQLGYTASADAYEPNNDYATATLVQLDQAIVGNILPAGDSDWYKVVIPTPGDFYLVAATAAPELSLTYRIWNANQQPISDWFSAPEPGKATTGAISITEAMTYTVELRDSNGAARSAQPYVLRLSMQPIDPATLSLPGAAVTPTVPPATEQPATPTTTKTATTPITPTGKVTILTSGQVGPLGAELFVSGPPGIDGARLMVPPGATDVLTTVDIAVTPDAPANAPFGLQPAGLYWIVTPAGMQFKQPVTLTLPVPAGAASAEMFIGHWDGKQWVDLDGKIENGLISAPTTGFSQFGVFCGRLADYAQVSVENASGSPYINLRYVSGPSPDPAQPDAFIGGCAAPYDLATMWELKQNDMAFMLLRPGVYEFNVAYPQPQPGVANSLFVTIPPGGGQQTIRITDDGATSDNAGTKIDFPGRNVVQGSNVRPIIACNAELPGGVVLASGDPASAALPSRIVLVSNLKLEQMPPKGPGIRLTAVANDPEGSGLHPFWTVTGATGKATTAGDPVASGVPIPDQSTFRPTVGGDYTVFLTVYDDKGLFDECRWVLPVTPNTRPEIKVFSGRTVVEFGRLDQDRGQGAGVTPPATTVMRPGTPVPLPIPSRSDGSSVFWDGLTLCPTAIAGPFAVLPEDINTIVTTPAPVDVMLPPIPTANQGADVTNRWQYPGRTCVWALTADADNDVLTTTWEFPGPIYGSGTFYAAVGVPANFHADAPTGIALGTFMNTTQQLNAYNAWITELANRAGVPPAIVWEAWDDPCPPGSGDVQNPCPSSISLGGVENIVAGTTDGFSLPPRTGYAPIAVMPEGESEGGDCGGVFFISSLTPDPTDPGPNQDVRVKAMVSPIVEGCVLDMSIRGTDTYANQALIPTNKSGEAALFIPGGAEGIVDVVTARFCSPLPEGATAPAGAGCQTPTGRNGQWVEMRVTYTF